MTNREPLLIAVMGPTGSGKTPLAEALADELDAQLINSDAFQVYRKLDIGTAKPVSKDRYKLLDLIEPNEPFGLGEWLKLAAAEITRSYEMNQNVILVGGTGLYVRALFEQYSGMSGQPDPGLRRLLNETPIEQLRERLEPGVVGHRSGDGDRIREALRNRDRGFAEHVRVRLRRALRCAFRCAFR